MSILKQDKEKTSVDIEFVISGDEFELDAITNELDINPTVQWNKGDSVKHRQITRQDTTWCYGIGLHESFDIEEQTIQFLSIFADKIKQIQYLKENYCIECLVLYTIRVYNSETPVLSLGCDIINFASNIGAKIDFDLYYC